MQEYNICYSLDSKYAEQLAVSITSILKNADKKDIINFYILDGGLSQKDKDKIELLKDIKPFNIQFFDINENDFIDYPLLKNSSSEYEDYHVTVPTYFRFKLPQLLNQYQKVLYLDCDIIVRSSLKELFGININDYAVAMILDAESEKEAKRLNIKKYFNAGVMLINLDYWRKHNIENKLLDYAKNNKDKILWQDQDIINVVLKDKIKQLENIWNFQYFQYEEINTEELSRANIFHLAGRFKPWLMPFESNIYDEYYYYLLFTEWKNNIVKYKHLANRKHLKNQTGGKVTNIIINASDEDLKNIYEEINKTYLQIEESKYITTCETDEKISLVYEEIDKNYKYTNQLTDNIKKEIDTNSSIIDSAISNMIDVTDEKLKILEEVFGTQIEKASGKLKKESSLQLTEAYAYINEQTSKIYKDVKNISCHLENTLNDKIYDLHKKADDSNYELFNLKNNVETKIDINILNSTIQNLKTEISEQELIYQEELKKLKNEFEEKINKQRITYENKLIKMENKLYKIEEKLNQKPKSPLKRFLEKLKR